MASPDTQTLVGKTYSIKTFGCQMNMHDSERVSGLLDSCGCIEVASPDDADIVVYMTCCVRENADQRLYGQASAMVSAPAPPSGRRIVAVGGCIAQRDGERLRAHIPNVDVVFGTSALASLPRLLAEASGERPGVIEVDTEEPGTGFSTDLPSHRAERYHAWVPIMSGCNNFCTYCIVPYVRGRERSRHPEEIEREARELVAAGYKDITLLGQNVDSYGRDLDEGVDFADLIRRINAIPGDFVIRFMSSHPKDATEKLFRAMAECEKCAHQMHLPVQSGNDRVLHAMNRGYTREKYLAQVALARQYMPDLVLTTDIIVGFPGETDEEFDDTLSLIETVRYDAMFTFIYSPRVGTPAAKMPDPYTRAQKQVRFDALVAAANRISEEKHRAYEGSVQRVLVDGADGRGDHPLTARTKGGRLVHMRGDASLVGQFVDVKITGSNTWALYGEEV